MSLEVIMSNPSYEEAIKNLENAVKALRIANAAMKRVLELTQTGPENGTLPADTGKPTLTLVSNKEQK
jgi:hypothetical protein